MMPMPPRGDWKTIAADKLNRIGRRGSAKALYGINDQNRPPADEMLLSQRREASKRRAAMPKPRSQVGPRPVAGLVQPLASPRAP